MIKFILSFWRFFIYIFLFLIFCYNFSMDKQIITLANRKKSNLVSLVFFFFLYGVILLSSIGLIIFVTSNFTPDYSYYFLIMLAIIFGGVSGYLLFDTIYFTKKLKANNKLNQSCLILNTDEQYVTVYGLFGSYQIPLNNIVKLSGDAFFSHSLLSLTYINKNRQKQSIDIGIVNHILKTKKEIKSILVSYKR